MRSASKIILIVGSIISIVVALIFFILGGVFAAAGAVPTEEIVAQIQQGTITTTLPGTVQEQAEAFKVMSTGLGVFFIVVAVFNVLNTIFGFVANAKKTTGLHVCNIVFGVLSLTEVNLVGGIFGLIANGQEKSNE